MSLRVGHQINYYSIPLQFYIIKRDKDNLNLSNTDSRLAEGKYDTALIKDEAKSSCKSPVSTGSFLLWTSDNGKQEWFGASWSARTDI